MLKVLILADPNSPHIIKWAKGLSSKDISVFIYGTNILKTNAYEKEKGIEVKTFGFSSELLRKTPGSFEKIKYISIIKELKKVYKEFKPDIVHAHFATSYGLFATILNHKPTILSVWGEDVYKFPRKSLLHKKLFQLNLKRADQILSTSKIMAEEIKKYTDKNIIVTPFGIDTELFKPEKVKNENPEEVVFGIVKSLEKKYGVEYLIMAFDELNKRYPNNDIRLLIVGDGSIGSDLKKLAEELELKNIEFTGSVEFTEIQKYHNKIDVEVYPSIDDSESFGVSIVEAGACGNPVIVSRVGGLKEVVIENETGLFVEKEDHLQLADAMERLLVDKNLRTALGKNGRDHILAHYDFKDNLAQMVEIYKNNLNNSK